ncbi:peptidylprolyl isomerase [Flavobacterium suaedae]|uniref:Periplasmic chaperone PpiD n=1 Tax=Flavobacterium suaedae TaxID=1767027 RepID=A0ABQ1JJ60_9FLAO|nr:peptidylprolyl isomerase [Flavobacterium suaedae]GGB70370.1 peptidylprolyl isomerase [Flavobacterium suaedae]
MAVLSKIRQRSLLLILVIGFCLLAFIIGDIINSGGFGVTKNIGSVNGTDIPAREFLEKVSNAQQRQQRLTPTQAANIIWNQEVERILYEEHIEDTGLRVGENHVYNMYGQSPQFQNELGQFDRAKLNKFFVDTKNNDPALWQQIQNNIPAVEDAAKKQLYITMVKAGFVATEFDGESKYKLENDKVSFDYVYVPYTTVNDDEVEVSDEEIKSYMQKHEDEYKADASRDIEYVLVENKASKEDEANIREDVNQMLSSRVVYNEQTKANDTLPGFKGVSKEKIKSFVDNNSEIAFDTTYVVKKNLPVDYAEQIFNLQEGEVFGPYKDGEYYKLTRVVNRRPGANAKVSHILIAYDGSQTPKEVNRTKEEAEAKANELLKKVNANPDSFADLAKENSDDTGSVNNGGVYDDVYKGQMVPEFDKFVFDNPVGKTGVVETDYGFHVIKVLDKYEGVQVATIAKKIQPSEDTVDDLFTKATKLEMDAGSETEKSFEDLAKEADLEIAVAENLGKNEENIRGLGAQRTIVKWAFAEDTEVGDVKKYDVSQGYVIARLKAKSEDGFMSVESAKDKVLPILRNEKKAAKIKEKMQGDTLEAVAQKAGSSIAKAQDIALARPLVPKVGNEAKVVGRAFALGEGNTSGLIEGNTGVFMIKTTGITKAKELPNYNAMVASIRSKDRAGVQNRLTTALKEDADIEDNRSEFN